MGASELIEVSLTPPAIIDHKKGPCPTRPIIMERKSDERIVEAKRAQ
jgi:hypothetical protein